MLGKVLLWIIVIIYIISPFDFLPLNPIDDLAVFVVGLVINGFIGGVNK